LILTPTLVLGTLLIAANCTKSQPEHPATLDPRTAVALPAEGQQAVLHEMRTMLGAISGALAATAREDTTALLAALRPAGMAAAADPALEEKLPAAWKQLAEKTHGAFDSLAVAARRAPRGVALRDVVLTRLADIGGTCNACHEQFRVTVL